MMSNILNTYLKELVFFPLENQLHFFTRLFRITGNEKFLIPVKNILELDIEKRLHFAEQLKNFDPQLIDSKESVRSTIRRNPLENARIQRRETYYQSFPILKYYYNVLSSIQTLLDNKLHEGKYSSRILSITSELKNHDWSWFLSPNHILINPVNYVNCAFFLSNLEINDGVNYLETIINNTFSPDHLFDKIELFDQLYTFTHVIIGESKFYQQFLSPNQVKKYDWIYNFFEKNFLDFYQKINLDLILEVILCYNLAKKNIPIIIKETAENYLSSYLDNTRTYLVADKEATLCDMEHANILLIMTKSRPSVLFSVKKPLF